MANITYTVKNGDTIWDIAYERRTVIAGSNIQARIATLVKLNGLKYSGSKVLIYPGQVLYLSKSSTSTKNTTTKPSSSNKVVITKIVPTAFGLQSDNTSGREVFATWNKWNDSKTTGYTCRWQHYLNGKWIGSDTDIDHAEDMYCYSTFNADAAATKVRFWVRPYHKSGDKKSWLTNVDWSDVKEYNFSDNPPQKPSVPNVKIDNRTLTVSIDNIDANALDATSVKFNIVKDNTSSVHTSSAVKINTTTNYVSYQYTVTLGSEYKVRACCVNSKGKTSGWSEFSTAVGTKPSAPSGITTHKRKKRSDGTISAYLEWSAVTNATSYVVEYTTVKDDFDNAPGNVQEAQTDGARTSIEITGITAGYDYFFRVRAVNDKGESDPTSIVEIPIGEPPAAPTTWSNANSVFEGESLELNWTHNARDGSSQTFAQLSLKIGDNDWTSFTFTNTTDENSGERTDIEAFTYGQSISYRGTLYVKIDTTNSNLKNNKIQWKVRTAGVTDAFSDIDWSIERTVYVYERPNLVLSMVKDLAEANGSIIEQLDSFPFYIRANVDLDSYILQKPIGYHLRIVSNVYYETVDDTGRTKVINSGDAIYSKYFDTSEVLIVEMSANNVDIESGIPYTVVCVADMSTGLSIEQSYEFSVSWKDVSYVIDATILVDDDAYAAVITPYCVETPSLTGPEAPSMTTEGHVDDRYMDTNSGNLYICTAVEFDEDALEDEYTWELIGENAGDTAPSASTVGNVDDLYLDRVTGTVYRCTKVIDGECEWVIDGANPVENVTISIYRREYDGSLTEISANIPNNGTSVTDPHPSLDYARYRLVAKDTLTGAISFHDMAGYPVEGHSVIIQWDEEWSNFDVMDEHSVEGPAWSGSLLKLSYNIDVTDSRQREVELVKYVGREHPVSYYGTQRGENSTWNVTIPKEDKETIYALRRLSLWSGDVYVREPSGMGYWANVGVSFNQKHTNVTVPVTLNITRVEGGV